MAEGLLGGILGEEDEKPDVESSDPLAGAEEALGRRPSLFAFRGELLIASQHEPLAPLQL